MDPWERQDGEDEAAYLWFWGYVASGDVGSIARAYGLDRGHVERIAHAGRWRERRQAYVSRATQTTRAAIQTVVDEALDDTITATRDALRTYQLGREVMRHEWTRLRDASRDGPVLSENVLVRLTTRLPLAEKVLRSGDHEAASVDDLSHATGEELDALAAIHASIKTRARATTGPVSAGPAMGSGSGRKG